MSENNESATQNADVAFQLRSIGQQLELLSRMYKDLKDEVNSIKQQNSGADHQGNTVRMAARNVRSDFEEFVDENADEGEDDCLTAFYDRLVLTRKCTSVRCSN